MEKRLEPFLRYLEHETSIRFDFSAGIAPSKFLDPTNGSMKRNMVFINDWTLALFIDSYCSKGNKKIKSLEVLYGNEAMFNDALMMKIKIESVFPDIPITIINMDEHLRRCSIYYKI